MTTKTLLSIAMLALGASALLVSGGASAIFIDQAQNGSNAFVTDVLDPPTGVSASGGASVTLNWTATSDAYASGHRVLRATGSGGPYSQIAEVTPRTTTTYVDSPSAGTYYYVVRAFHQSWESADSNEASATVSGPIYYLHNNPTPPTGNTNSQTNLPLDTFAPTATTLYNYDQNRDAFAGLLVAKGGSGAAESDTTKYQNWLSGALGSALTINGTVNVRLWSSMKDFQLNKTGSVRVFLRHYNGSGYTEICNGTLTQANWQGGSSTWVEKTVTFSCASYTIPAGDRLEVKVIVPSAAEDNMWLAYDTTTYSSRAELP